MNVYEYHFSSEARVADDNLLDATRYSLDATNGHYRANRRRYFGEAYSAIHRESEIPHAHFWQSGDSTDDVVLIINPFGTPIVPPHTAQDMAEYIASPKDSKKKYAANPNDANKLLQAKFLYDSMPFAEIKDGIGKNMPVIVVSSPSLDHRTTLDRRERHAISSGDFSPMANRALDIAMLYNYNRIHAAGYSLCTIAARAVELAGGKDFDVLSGNYVGDAPNFKSRRPVQPLPLGILLPYMFDAGTKKFENNWAAANGLLPRKEGQERGESYSLRHWFGNGNALANLAIAKGLSRNRFSETLDYMTTHGIPTAVSWSDSRLMRGFSEYIEGQPSAVELAGRGLLKLFRAKEAPHISGENPVFLTDVMLRSLKFAQAVRTAQ
jgi:hypothetical protein